MKTNNVGFYKRREKAMDSIILENYNERINEYEDLYLFEKNPYMKIHIFEVVREMKFARKLIERLIEKGI